MRGNTPTAFLSYSWEGAGHKAWIRDFATRLRAEGVDVRLDEWAAALGDQLPAFMESAVRENDFVLVVCTPHYKQKSDSRRGGVGYEGDMITGEVLAAGNHRKFLPVLREGEWHQAAPSWMTGKLYVDLRGSPYCEANYQKLLKTLHGRAEGPPLIGCAPGEITGDMIAGRLSTSRIHLCFSVGRPRLNWEWAEWDDMSLHQIALLVAATVLENEAIPQLRRPSGAKFTLSSPGGLTRAEANISFTSDHLMFEVEKLRGGEEGFLLEGPTKEALRLLWKADVRSELVYEQIVATDVGEIGDGRGTAYRNYVDMRIPFLRPDA